MFKIRFCKLTGTQNQRRLHQILKIKKRTFREIENGGSLPTLRPTTLNLGTILSEQPLPKRPQGQVQQ